MTRLSAAVVAAHDAAVAGGEPGYLDPDTGLFVFTSAALAERGNCCDSGCRHCPYTRTAEDAVRNAHAWFEWNSGWAPPDEDTLADWEADGVSRAPDECLVTPDGWCRHGLASWHLIIAALGEH